MRALRCPHCHKDDSATFYEPNAFCNECKKTFTQIDEVRDIFHQLWGLASFTEMYYRKDLWNRLRELMDW